LCNRGESGVSCLPKTFIAFFQATIISQGTLSLFDHALKSFVLAEMRWSTSDQRLCGCSSKYVADQANDDALWTKLVYNVSD